MSIVLHYHPFSRAANVLWMLEEVGASYEIRHVDLMKGAQKQPELTSLNPMGKLPVLIDGHAVVTESAAIALYLADRYAYGRLCPRVDEPARGTYLRWAFFAPSVIEPGAMAKAAGWEFKPGQAGWGKYDEMVAAMDRAVERGFILGETFSMADVVFGGTVRYMLMFEMIAPTPALLAYSARLAERPALKRADELNAKYRDELGLKS